MSEMILELHNELITKEQEINRLKDIIREAREKIEALAEDDENFFGEIDIYRKQELLKILDKVGEE